MTVTERSNTHAVPGRCVATTPLRVGQGGVPPPQSTVTWTGSASVQAAGSDPVTVSVTVRTPLVPAA